MSLIRSKSFIEDGDLVFLYGGYKNSQALHVERGKVTQVKNGAIRHDELIGLQFGAKYSCPRGDLSILSPSPELWSLHLPHRTQILYSTDISMVTLLLYLRPGSKVIEAGTGSGSLSHSILRTIAPSGHLNTFDFHQERVNTAIHEFKSHGLDHLVTCKQRDVCEQGFDLINEADAVFLDLPKPWLAIPFAYKALKNRGTTRICCFSPCIEQVQRTTRTLQQNRFIDVETFEILLRPYEFKQCSLRNFDIDQLEQEDNSIEIANDLADDQMMEETKDQGSDEILHLNEKNKSKFYVTATPVNEVAGHTGFLTFATKL